jgi:glyoxylase-like metal-dependent hydrolase (beta-lactamase superfamily II)
VNYTALHAANPGPFTGDGNWTYLIPGALPVLIDAGVGNESHLTALAAAAPSGPARVLVTHAHSDHATGAAAIHARWPSAPFAKYPWPERDARYQVQWHSLDDGAVVATDQGELEAVHTPGHSPDHLAFWHAASKTVFVGDLLIQGTTVFIPGSRGGNLSHYLASLRRLRALQPRRALPAHGPAIDDPLALIDHYIAHREQRESQVVAALQSGLDTVDAITASIYSGHAAAILPMAKDSVLAHLRKLSDECRALTDKGAWQLVDP